MAGGFFNLLSKKEENKQQESVDSLREELKKQDTWIKHLHNYSRDLHKYTTYIEDSNAKHKKEIVSEINNIYKDLSKLSEVHTELKREFALLRRELENSLKRDFEQYHKILETYSNLRFEQNKIDKEEIKAKILEDLKPKESESKETEEIVMPSYKESIELSNPERELLNLMFNENKPMTYEDISAKLHKSLNSVRVYMNSLRSKKPIIEEFGTPNGVKVFSIKNSELVRTLFNLK